METGSFAGDSRTVGRPIKSPRLISIPLQYHGSPHEGRPGIIQFNWGMGYMSRRDTCAYSIPEPARGLAVIEMTMIRPAVSWPLNGYRDNTRPVTCVIPLAPTLGSAAQVSICPTAARPSPSTTPFSRLIFFMLPPYQAEKQGENGGNGWPAALGLLPSNLRSQPGVWSCGVFAI